MIRLHHVDKRYGTTWALRDVCLDIPPGTIVGLIGPNGAGKTTILRVAAGLTRPSAGELRFDAGRVSRRGPGRVGYLPQQAGFNSLATPGEVLRLFARLRDLPSRSVADALDEAGLTAVAGRELRTLSGGTRQRLALAVACLGDPDLLLLDEPDAGLDPRAAIELRRRARALASRGRAVVISSHSLPELEATCDSLALLVAGSVVLSGTVADLARRAPRGSLEELFLEATA